MGQIMDNSCPNINMKDRINNMSVFNTFTLKEVLRAIDKGALGIAIIVNPTTNAFEGVVTDGDIRRFLLKGFGLNTPVLKIPRPKSISVPAETPIDKISSMFSDPVRVIPLLDKNHVVIDLAIFDKRVHLPVAEPILDEKEVLYVNDCILTGWVSSSGKYVSKFEEMFAKFCDTEIAITTNSGTSALHLALLACDIGSGDEVIVPSLTFIASANAVTYTGAKPVFADSENETWNIDPASIEKLISKNTKAIIPVHLYGHPANMDPIIEIAKRYGLYVIEDAAEAHGAEYKGKKVGSIGDLAIFSFFGNKIITTGEGGMIVTNNRKLADKIRLLRDHGMQKDRRYWHPVLGFNYRMTNIQAALGVAQMEKIDPILIKKRQIAKIYSKKLKNIAGLGLPSEAEWARSVFWLYSILIDQDILGITRHQLMQRLREQGIETRPLFPVLHHQPIYTNSQVMPVAEKLSSQGLSLPSSAHLSTESVERVANTIREIALG
jgi:perosamine synthetase